MTLSVQCRLACVMWLCSLASSQDPASYASCQPRPSGSVAICSALNEFDCDGAFGGLCQWTLGGLTTQINPPDLGQAGCKCFGTAGMAEEQCLCNHASHYRVDNLYSGPCSRWSKAECDAQARMVRRHLNSNWAECGRGEKEACESLSSKELCHQLGSRVVSNDSAASNASCVWVDTAECSDSHVFGCTDEVSCSAVGGRWCATCTETENTFSQFIPSLEFVSRCHPDCHGDNAMCNKLTGCEWNWEGSASHQKTYWCQRTFSIGGTAGAKCASASSMLLLVILVQVLQIPGPP